jgi:hypothetical protein
LAGICGNLSKLWQIFNLFSGRKITIIVCWCYKSLECKLRLWGNQDLISFVNYF